METLTDVARRHDETVLTAREELVHAVRAATAGGMTQSEIARAIGRSQPEVSRLLRFHGTTPLARRVRGARRCDRATRTDPELFGTAWPSMWGMRNRIAHGYLLVETDIVRSTVDRDVPRIIGVIEAALDHTDC